MNKARATVARMIAAGALGAVGSYALAQQAYPTKQIRIIVPYAPGSNLDVLSRILGPKLAEGLGQQVIVDNRPGGNTVIGSEALVKSPPDGYTLLNVVNTHVIVPSLMPKLPYDPIKDFAPIATVTSSELVLIIHPSVPANNLNEFIALAKAKPGQLNYSSAGGGSTTHLAAELFSMMTGVRMQHIPYKGAGPALADLVAGQTQLFFTSPLIIIPYIKSGKLKAMAISGDKRLSTLPQLPTFTEAGLPNYDVKVWFGYLAPAGTPKAIIDRLSAEFARVMAIPEFKEKMVSQGMDPFTTTPEQFAALIKADVVKYARVIKVANIKLDN